MDALKQQIRELMVTELMLPMGPEAIATDAPLFSPEGLALDSVDALQLVVALEKKFGLKLADSEAARTALHSIDTIAAAIEPGFRSSRCLRGAEAWLLKAFGSAAAASSTMPPKEQEALSGQCSSLSGASNFGVRVEANRTE